jgi:predicted dithiol-disulfide oxidoreductase (DUF899 family)
VAASARRLLAHQLIVYHFTWRHEDSGFPGEDQGCPTCSVVADNIGDLSHLHPSNQERSRAGVQNAEPLAA